MAADMTCPIVTEVRAAARSGAPAVHDLIARWRSELDAMKAPLELADVPGIRRFDPPERGYVYFLVHEGEVVYVGQTTRYLFHRIRAWERSPHIEFDDVWYIEADWSELDELEVEHIRRLRPIHNHRGMEW